MKWTLNILSGLKSWFVNIEIHIHADKYITNIARAIEEDTIENRKDCIKKMIHTKNGKMDKNFNKFLKDKGLS